jgi:hypothetical protein
VSNPSNVVKFACAVGIWAFSVLIVIFIVFLWIPQYRLPPGAVFQTNEEKEWRVVMSDGAVTPVRSKDRVASLAWDYWEVNQATTNSRTWRTVR